MLADALEKAFESGLGDPVGKERANLVNATIATLEAMATDLRIVSNALELVGAQRDQSEQE
jgi:hypothetical protein